MFGYEKKNLRKDTSIFGMELKKGRFINDVYHLDRKIWKFVILPYK